MLAVGTPVVLIEDEGTKLEAVVYIPADQGKSVKPGFQVRLAPTTVKREEFGTMIGTVSNVSEFPVTPHGMTAVLHNDQLVKLFSKDGAPYAVSVQLEQDASTPREHGTSSPAIWSCCACCSAGAWCVTSPRSCR